MPTYYQFVLHVSKNKCLPAAKFVENTDMEKTYLGLPTRLPGIMPEKCIADKKYLYSTYIYK